MALNDQRRLSRLDEMAALLGLNKTYTLVSGSSKKSGS